MKGNKYDEKVDIFSFGIVMCDIISRVQADPDYLPRSSDFGLNRRAFKEKFCANCPECFYTIAFLCCDLNPDKRPPFEVMAAWFENLVIHLSKDVPVPSDLDSEIKNYPGLCPSSSESSTPDATSPQLKTITEGQVKLLITYINKHMKLILKIFNYVNLKNVSRYIEKKGKQVLVMIALLNQIFIWKAINVRKT